MLLENWFPYLPTGMLDTIVMVVAILGGIMLVYSQFVEAENRRDLIRMIGSFALMVYGISILNIIIILTMMGLCAAATVEFIEILLGYHKHTRKDVHVYEYIGKTTEKVLGNIPHNK